MLWHSEQAGHFKQHLKEANLDKENTLRRTLIIISKIFMQDTKLSCIQYNIWKLRNIFLKYSVKLIFSLKCFSSLNNICWVCAHKLVYPEYPSFIATIFYSPHGIFYYSFLFGILGQIHLLYATILHFYLTFKTTYRSRKKFLPNIF